MSSAAPMELPLEWHLWLTWHVYKVCSQGGCPESAVLAAIDLAIRDGVNVISLSLGSFPKKSFLQDTLKIATFWAVQHGIFVSCSAGNVGPFDSSVSGPAPWVLTVGASTIDRSIRAVAKLGNRQEYMGESLFQPGDFKPKLLPLVYSEFCDPQTLERVRVRGKIVLCQGIGGASGVLEVKK